MSLLHMEEPVGKQDQNKTDYDLEMLRSNKTSTE